MANVLLFVMAIPACFALRDFEVAKMTANGEISATDATINGVSYHEFSTDGVPDHNTANFPTNYNPNEVGTHSLIIDVRTSPSYSSDGVCLNMGPIGLTVSGAVFYSPFTSSGTDAVLVEQFDSCSGHPDPSDVYHYHGTLACIVDSNERDQFLGVAKDGYPIYGPIDADGNTLTNDDLDACHGRYETYTYDGNSYTDYRYRLTYQFPYMLGCYRGVPNANTNGRNCQFATPSPSPSPAPAPVPAPAPAPGPIPGERPPPPPGGNRPPPPGGDRPPPPTGGRPRPPRPEGDLPPPPEGGRPRPPSRRPGRRG